MKNRLISWWTMGRLVDGAKDGARKYSLRKVNQLPKVIPAIRPPAGVAKTTAPADISAPLAPAYAPPEWVATAPRPAAAPAPEMADAGKQDGSEVPTAISDSGISLPGPLLHPTVEERDLPRASVRGADARPILTTATPPQPSLFDAAAESAGPKRADVPKPSFLSSEKLKAWLGSGLALLPKALPRFRGKSRSSDSAPRAQAELALNNVTVLRNDLSDVDVEVVAVPRKAAAAQAASSPSATSSGGRGTAWWAKAKSPFAAGKKETGSIPVVATGEKQPSRPAEIAQTPP